jgi:hypothetical protein
MLNPLLKKLIKTASGRTRFVMAVVGLSVALLLILSAVQVQQNYNDLLYGKTNKDSVANFLVINKTLNSSTIGSTNLTEADIHEIKKQSFVDEVGILTPSRFKASIESYSDRFPFSTDISFESVPASFIDVNTKEWKWDSSQNFVPIIAPNMFLDFYNFEFSFSQNMPQLTHEVVKKILFKVNIHTGHGDVSYTGRIVGFSDRITSLLVPEEFMQWANGNFRINQNTQPSRVVIKTKDPGNPKLVSFLEQKGFATDAEKTRFSKYRKVVDIVVKISWITGAVMLVFALLIFTLFIQLTIASCKDEIQLLITLGSSPKQLHRFLIKQFFPPNIIIIALTLIIISALQWLAFNFLQSQSMAVNNFISVYTIATAIFILLVLWLVNTLTIKKYISLENR